MSSLHRILIVRDVLQMLLRRFSFSNVFKISWWFKFQTFLTTKLLKKLKGIWKAPRVLERSIRLAMHRTIFLNRLYSYAGDNARWSWRDGQLSIEYRGGASSANIVLLRARGEQRISDSCIPSGINRFNGSTGRAVSTGL